MNSAARFSASELMELLGVFEREVMPKLFEVTISRTAYVLAETAEAAKEMQSEIEKWESFPEVEAEPWDGGTLHGWDDRCLVYHKGNQDILLRDAKKMVTPNA